MSNHVKTRRRSNLHFNLLAHTTDRHRPTERDGCSAQPTLRRVVLFSSAVSSVCFMFMAVQEQTQHARNLNALGAVVSSLRALASLSLKILAKMFDFYIPLGWWAKLQLQFITL